MKNALRISGLVAIVSLAALSGVRDAQAGTCRITCGNGQTDNASTSTRSQCCFKIETFCGNDGYGTYNGVPCPVFP